MVEIVIVIAIIGIIMSLGLVLSMDSFRGYYFRGERSMIVSVLTRARSQAMANYNGTTHGACYDATNKNYVIFQGTYSASSPTNETITGNKSMNIATTSSLFSCSNGGIKFSQLSGNATPDTFAISDGLKYGVIEINTEGAINW